VQPGKRQLHLRLDTCDTYHLAARRLAGQVVQQHGLADTRLAAQHENPALTRADRLDQPVQRGALRPPVRQPRRAALHRETCRPLHDTDAIRAPGQRTSVRQVFTAQMASS